MIAQKPLAHKPPNRYTSIKMKRRALLSVSDKTGMLDLARVLNQCGWEIISTGGTAAHLTQAGISVTLVENVTGFPECFGGRVKTMHPMIMGGVLYRRNDPIHVREAHAHNISPIDLVVVNLYPFKSTLEEAKASGRFNQPDFLSQAVEQIDIGGPTLLRSAAKNFESVTVVCDPADYERVKKALMAEGDTSPELKKSLAAKAFLHTASYDGLICEYLSGGQHTGITLTGGTQLRYGENPHQRGAFHVLYPPREGDDCGAKPWVQHQGKDMSYLNILDADAAWTTVMAFSAPTAVMVKHCTPSGIASSENIEDAFQRAYDTDRLSAFGVIIALNRPCTTAIARKIIEQKIFTEVLIAPSYDEEALAVLREKQNIRVLTLFPDRTADDALLYRSALGGILSQTPDAQTLTAKDIRCVTRLTPTEDQIRDLLFAWACVKHVKSNAIVLAKDLVTVGIGAGQTSRVDSTWIAARRAGERAKGAVLASDAFFPFPDSLSEAASHGISAIVQPGGSVRDSEVIAEADRLGLAMVFTGSRAFRH